MFPNFEALAIRARRALVVYAPPLFIQREIQLFRTYTRSLHVRKGGGDLRRAAKKNSQAAGVPDAKEKGLAREPRSRGLEDGDELPGHLVAHLGGGGAAAQVRCAKALVEGLVDGGLDGAGLVREVERVAEHHGDGEDGADGVDDALARDIGGRACEQGFSRLVVGRAETRVSARMKPQVISRLAVDMLN